MESTDGEEIEIKGKMIDNTDNIIDDDKEDSSSSIEHTATTAPVASSNGIDDLFGDDDDDDDANDGYKETNADAMDVSASSDKEGEGDGEANKNTLDDLFGEDDVEIPLKYHNRSMKEKSISNLMLPHITKMSKNTQNIALRTPNFIKIQPQAYDRSTHVDREEESSFDGSKVLALIRWRHETDSNGNIMCDDNNVPIKVSNSRIVKWSDGSYQLIVGDAVFESTIIPTDNSFAFLQQKSINDTNGNGNGDDDNRSATELCLECTGQIHSRMTLNPVSLDSDIHTRMTIKVADGMRKTHKINLRDYETILVNPEVEQEQRAKKEEEKLRTESRSRNKSRDISRSKLPSMSSSYLTDNADDYESFSIANLKKNAKFTPRAATSKPKRKYGDKIESDEEDDDDDEEEEGEMDDFIVKDDDNGHGDDDDDDDDDDDEFVDEGAPESEDDVNTSDDDDDDNRKHSSSRKSNKKSKKDKKRVSAAADNVDKDDVEDSNQRKKPKRAIVDSDDD